MKLIAINIRVISFNTLSKTNFSTSMSGTLHKLYDIAAEITRYVDVDVDVVDVVVVVEELDKR